MNGIHLRPGRPLLAARARPWAGALAACCAVLVAVLGVLFAHQARADGFDRAIDSRVISWLGGHHGLLLWLAAGISTRGAAVFTAVAFTAVASTGRGDARSSTVSVAASVKTAVVCPLG